LREIARQAAAFGFACLLLACAFGRAAEQTPSAQETAQEATRLLQGVTKADASEAQRLLSVAASRLETLATATLPPELQKQLRSEAAELRVGASVPRSADTLKTVERSLLLLAQIDGTAAPGLSFQGSFSRAKPKDPAYGGHASSMGPAPIQAPMPAIESPVAFEEPVRLPLRLYGGGPTKEHIIESGGSGVALFDYDSDGLLDIYFVNAYELDGRREAIPHRNALFRNLGGFKFQDVSATAGVDAAAWGNGVCVSDYDSDGRLDIYVTNWGKNLLYRNLGSGSFREQAAAAGVAASGWSTGCGFFDADGDGDLDLYVARYVNTSWEDVRKAQRSLKWRGGPNVMVGPAGLPGEADIFFENQGNGTFRDATAAFGLVDGEKTYGFGVVTTDYDGDGLVDVFVANDSNPNLLYRNLGKGRFESVGLSAGVALPASARAQAGMGADSGDYDGDGLLDLIVTTFAHDVKTLYRNLGSGQFEDATVAAGLAAPTFEPLGWGVAFADFDLDGALDLFLANGHIHPGVDQFPDLKESYRQKNQLLINKGGVFRDVSPSAGSGLKVQKSHRGMAVGDLDNDGDLDVVVSAIDDTPTVLENRQRAANHWVAFRLEQPGKNRFAIGARVVVTAGEKRQIREVRSGGGYVSQNDMRAHFGLGSHQGTVDVEVRVPFGRTWAFRGLAPNRLHVLALNEGASR
jgi:hypothetical protein